MAKTTTVGKPARFPIDHLCWVEPGTTLRPVRAGEPRTTVNRQPATVVSLAGRTATVTIHGRWFTASVYGLSARRG